jgi:hypothetical protein
VFLKSFFGFLPQNPLMAVSIHNITADDFYEHLGGDSIPRTTIDFEEGTRTEEIVDVNAAENENLRMHHQNVLFDKERMTFRAKRLLFLLSLTQAFPLRLFLLCRILLRWFLPRVNLNQFRWRKFLTRTCRISLALVQFLNNLIHNLSSPKKAKLEGASEMGQTV